MIEGILAEWFSKLDEATKLAYFHNGVVHASMETMRAQMTHLYQALRDEGGQVKILDLFCKAGGASMGYHMAGFEVEGVDIEPQSRYPFKFHLGDALKINPKKVRRRYVAVVASPPCLGYTTLAALHPYIHHEKLIPATRDLLQEIGLPYIIENVENAKQEMLMPIKLCGSSFGLRVRRHRLFELGGFSINETPPCNHEWQKRHRPYPIIQTKARGHTLWSGTMPVYGKGTQLRDSTDWYRASVAMGIDWMSRHELNQAIPPVYTFWLGRRLRKWVQR